MREADGVFYHKKKINKRREDVYCVGHGDGKTVTPAAAISTLLV